MLAASLAAGTFAYISPAFAHRLARTETEVRVQADGKIEVTHIYHVHDVQRAFFEAGLIDSPDLTPLEARARLALHTRDHFKLRSADGDITLDIIDAEIIGHHAYLYQEGIASGPIDSVSATMLRDLISTQINSVNLIIDGETTTLDFSGTDGSKRIS
ncbi:MAG: DUF6702 family protein [Pseudomonadota bacterium]